MSVSMLVGHLSDSALWVQWGMWGWHDKWKIGMRKIRLPHTAAVIGQIAVGCYTISVSACPSDAMDTRQDLSESPKEPSMHTPDSRSTHAGAGTGTARPWP